MSASISMSISTSMVFDCIQYVPLTSHFVARD